MFSYQPLRSNRSIRLIKFLPGPDPKCQMITVEVEKAPPYVALSYTWGCKTRSRVIIVNGAEIAITSNLADAINAIFLFARERNMMFWADSICINQADVHERSKQVRLMNTIYRSAEIVAIWLGLAADDSDLAFDKMKEWKLRLDEMKRQFGGSDELAVTSISSDDPFFFGPNGSEQRRASEAVRKLCCRPWWSRAWVVQEGSISNPMRTMIFCGRRSIDWLHLRAAFGMSVGFQQGMAIRLDAFRKDRENGAHITLLSVLNHIRAYGCEDPRDKLYAALGMAMDVCEDDIVPDYTKSYVDVYIELARYFTTRVDAHSLDFLGEVWRSAPDTAFQHPHESRLPSWAPDWAFQGSLFPLEKVLDADKYGEYENAYNASGSFGGHCYTDGLYLHLQGSLLDYITRVWRPCEWNLVTGGLDVERSWKPDNASNLYFTGETSMEAFNHTLVTDTGRRNFQNSSELSRGFAMDWELVDRDRTNMTAEERQRQSWMCVDTKMMTFGRRLFETRRGFIVLAPAAAKIDDQVFVLMRGKVLYALRTRGDKHHEFIGECYVHGMMDGQACEDESFVLRDVILV